MSGTSAKPLVALHLFLISLPSLEKETDPSNVNESQKPIALDCARKIAVGNVGLFDGLIVIADVVVIARVALEMLN